MLRPQLGRLWASQNGASRRDPGTPKYLLGWVSEIPTYQVLNYLQYRQDTLMLALAERGIFEWGAEVVYKKGALAWDEVDSKIYIAKIASPGTTRPGANSNWEVSSAQIGRTLFDNTKSNIDNHIAATNNPHQLLPGTIGAYSKAEVDTIVANYYAQVQAHASNRNNPHGTKAVDVGAVPATGGRYSGDVIFGTGKVFLSDDKSKYAGYADGGVWLRDGQVGVGILDSGIPVAKDSAGTSSEIITEKSFAATKAQTEPFYAAPLPVFFVPFARDLNIYIGSGTSDYSDADGIPTWADNMIDWTANNATKTYVASCPAGVGTDSLTMAIDFSVQGSQGTGQLCNLVIFGDRTLGIEVTLVSTTNTTGWVEIWKLGNLIAKTPELSMTPGPRNRLAVTVTQSEVKVFGNGTLRATTPVTAWGTTNNPRVAVTSSVVNPQYSQSIGNLRIWNSALSDAMVSTL